MSPTAPEDVTLGELFRRLVDAEGRIAQQFTDVRQQIGSLQFVPREVYEAEVQRLAARLADLEDAKKWTGRTLVAAFLVPLMLTVVTYLVAR